MEWLGVSGGAGEILSQLCAISGEPHLREASEPAVQLEPMLST